MKLDDLIWHLQEIRRTHGPAVCIAQDGEGGRGVVNHVDVKRFDTPPTVEVSIYSVCGWRGGLWNRPPDPKPHESR